MSGMPKTWGHALRRLPEEERASCARLGWTCSGKCSQPATHEASYKYVTGRAGRISTRRLLKCDDHAAKFAAKYHVTADDSPAPTRAIDAAVSDVVDWMGKP